MKWLFPFDLDPDGSYRQAQEALRAAVDATASLHRLRPRMIATEALIAACIDQMLAPENRWAFRAMIERAEAEEPILGTSLELEL